MEIVCKLILPEEFPSEADKLDNYWLVAVSPWGTDSHSSADDPSAFDSKKLFYEANSWKTYRRETVPPMIAVLSILRRVRSVLLLDRVPIGHSRGRNWRAHWSILVLVLWAPGRMKRSAAAPVRLHKNKQNDSIWFMIKLWTRSSTPKWNNASRQFTQVFGALTKVRSIFKINYE